MQQEDDLRALAKIMDFLRAVSIILVVMNVYWYCYATVEGHGINIGVVDRILLNFNREAGQTLCTAPACPLMPRHEGSHQREDYLAENLGSPRYRICVLLHH